MLALQKEKLKIAGIALGEGDYKLGKLTQKDLMGLFGVVERNSEGRMVVRPDADNIRMPGMFPGEGESGVLAGMLNEQGSDEEESDEGNEDVDMMDVS